MAVVHVRLASCGGENLGPVPWRRLCGGDEKSSLGDISTPACGGEGGLEFHHDPGVGVWACVGVCARWQTYAGE